MQGVTKRCRLSWLTNSALAYEPQCGEWGAGLSQWVQLCTWSSNKLWRSNSIFNDDHVWSHFFESKHMITFAWHWCLLRSVPAPQLSRRYRRRWPGGGRSTHGTPRPRWRITIKTLFFTKQNIHGKNREPQKSEVLHLTSISSNSRNKKLKTIYFIVQRDKQSIL